MRGRGLVVMWCAIGCAGGDSKNASEPTDPTVPGLAVLGGGTHAAGSVQLDEIGGAADALAKPTDLAFHPDHPDELWVVNQADESVTIFWNVGTPDQQSVHAEHSTGEHFLANPSGLAFGNNGNWASIHDLNEPTQGGATPADFMGPTLWTGEREGFDGGDHSHLDMLHNSPNGKGIAWQGPGNRYWVFDGLHQSLTMYDFHDDHGLGGTDHRDGEVARYVEGELSPHARLPSHLEVDSETGLLYVADPGNQRIAVLDTLAGEDGDAIIPNYDLTDQYEVLNVSTETLIDTEAVGMGTPVGVALDPEGVLFVTSVDPNAIYAFSLDGTLLDWLDLTHEPNGIAIAEDGSLYFVDAKADKVVRVQAN